MKKLLPLFLFIFSVFIFAQPAKNALKSKAEECFKKSDFKCAENLYKQLLEDEYNAALQANYFNNLGTSQRRLGKTELAFISYDSAVKANPQDINSYINLGSLHSQKGNKEKALNYIKLGLMLDDQNPDLYLIRAKVYEDQKKMDLAEADYKNLISFQPENMIARSNYAIMKKNAGRYDEALKDYTQMITEKPESLLYNNRADVYLNMKKYKEALADVQKAITLDAKFPVSYVTKAKILFETNKSADGCNSLNKAVELGYEKIFIYGLLKKCEP